MLLSGRKLLLLLTPPLTLLTTLAILYLTQVHLSNRQQQQQQISSRQQPTSKQQPPMSQPPTSQPLIQQQKASQQLQASQQQQLQDSQQQANTNLHQHHHQLTTRFLKQTQVKIQLDRDNFVLINRCTMNKVRVNVNRRTKRPQLDTKVQRMNRKLSKKQLEESAKIKILSTVITVTNSHQILNSTAPQESLIDVNHHPQTSDRHAQFNDPLVVQLRANLTELYICFDPKGELEAKVSRATSVNGCHLTRYNLECQVTPTSCESHSRGSLRKPVNKLN